MTTDRRRPIRVLMLSGEAPPIVGGVGDYTVRLMRAIQAERPGWSLRLLTRRPKWYDPPVANVQGVWAYRPVHAWTHRWNRWAIALAKNLRYDLIHIQEEAFSWFEGDIAARIAELRPDVPVVVTLHELHQERSSFANARRTIDRASALVANDSRTAARCLNFAGRPVDRILFSPCNIDPLPMSKRPGVVHGRVCTFGFVNRLKRYDVLFEALKRVRAKHAELTWHIVGPFDPARDEVHQELAALVAGADWVRFTGALEAEKELPQELHAAEMLLLPFEDGASLRRGSLQAGWRFGLPVVTTRPPEAEPGLEEGSNVIFADRDDPAAWFEAVSRLLESTEERARIGGGGTTAAEKYTFEALAREHVAVYERLIRT